MSEFKVGDKCVTSAGTVVRIHAIHGRLAWCFNDEVSQGIWNLSDLKPHVPTTQPCQACGKECSMNTIYIGHYVLCTNDECCLEGPVARTTASAIELWNRLRMEKASLGPPTSPLFLGDTMAYMGERSIYDLEGTPFEGFEATDWALTYINRYGQIDGANHKQWVLDQVARILNGTPVFVKLATWDNGHSEYRFEVGEPTQEYLDWVGEDDEYDEGIAP